MQRSRVRVRNTWVIYHKSQNNLPKGWLILNFMSKRHRFYIKAGDLNGLAFCDKPAAYQLVGEVKAHQG